MSFSSGQFPDIKDQLEYFKVAFDLKTAKESGSIVPLPGVNEEYDQSLEDIRQIEEDLQQYLLNQRKRLNCKVRHFELIPIKFGFFTNFKSCSKIWPKSLYYSTGTLAKFHRKLKVENSPFL